MNIEAYREYCLSKPGATESVPFPKLPDVLVFKVAGQMFSATDMSTFESISIKHYPEKIEDLKAEYPSVIDPAYFSKKHWCFVLMDGMTPDDLIREWLDISYELVVAGLPKKVREELRLDG